mgnify:FL=1
MHSDCGALLPGLWMGKREGHEVGVRIFQIWLLLEGASASARSPSRLFALRQVIFRAGLVHECMRRGMRFLVDASALDARLWGCVAAHRRQDRLLQGGMVLF